MKSHATVLAAGALLAANAAFAGPDDYIHTPTVEYGEREIDLRFGTAKSGDTDRASAATLGVGWGATPWWFTELYVKYKREPAPTGDAGELRTATRYDAVEWENKFQLTETGKYPVDVGLLFEIERPRDHAEGWELKYGGLFQAEFGKVQLNANLLLTRAYRAEERTFTELLVRLQGKYRWREAFEFGVQSFSDLGKWDDWAPSGEQSHRIGPAVFGKLPLGGRHAVSYNAAWLFGASKAAPDNTFRMQVEYEF